MVTGNAKRYSLRHFVTDFEATEWINSMDALGYEVVSFSTCEVQNGRDRRERDVEITVLVRLNRLTALTPGSRPISVTPPAAPKPAGMARPATAHAFPFWFWAAA